MADKIDSNVTGLAIAEEESLKLLPVSPIWYVLEPNSYSDFGGEITKVARNPINPSRQQQKGNTTSLDASGGYNTDVTASNLQFPLQGFFFARAREKFDTEPLNGSVIAITNVDSVGNTYDAASGLDAAKTNDLLFASGFVNAENNGLKTVTAATATDIAVSETLVDETPTDDANLESVGYEFPTGDIELVLNSDSVDLTSTVSDFTTLDLNVGEWVFIGGDDTANRFVNNVGYGRIFSISANELKLDQTTFTPQSEVAIGVALQIYFGKVIRNEKDPALIEKITYQLERSLGDDGNGTQSEYLVGSHANEFVLNIPSEDKMNCDLSFIALDAEQRTGTEGLKPGSRIQPFKEDFFNTSTDVYRAALAINGFNANPLFAYVSEVTLNINNNVTPDKAIGVLGAFDTTAGNFVVSGTLTAYFSNVQAVQAVRNNDDVGFNVISTSKNKGFVIDIPLLGLGNGRLNVELDSPITLPLDLEAGESEQEYTALTCFFNYIPDIAMSS